MNCLAQRWFGTHLKSVLRSVSLSSSLTEPALWALQPRFCCNFETKATDRRSWEDRGEESNQHPVCSDWSSSRHRANLWLRQTWLPFDFSQLPGGTRAARSHRFSPLWSSSGSPLKQRSQLHKQRSGGVSFDRGGFDCAENAGCAKTRGAFQLCRHAMGLPQRGSEAAVCVVTSSSHTPDKRLPISKPDQRRDVRAPSNLGSCLFNTFHPTD